MQMRLLLLLLLLLLSMGLSMWKHNTTTGPKHSGIPGRNINLKD
jgi:hypothetical protein